MKVQSTGFIGRVKTERILIIYNFFNLVKYKVLDIKRLHVYNVCVDLFYEKGGWSNDQCSHNKEINKGDFIKN